MPSGFDSVFATLKPLLSRHSRKLAVKSDTPENYTLVTKSPSPFPQHKGNPLEFGSIKVGKAYVSFHLMPLYMCPELVGAMSPALKKRMQGKTCFNFKHEPDPELLNELKDLAAAGVAAWADRKWL
ncbi:MAG: hypothetical protein K2X35_01470 [Bryobacteraceae bacterium]|nr:hypothetical protein [Bryobacteraceae bacterium]